MLTLSRQIVATALLASYRQLLTWAVYSGALSYPIDRLGRFNVNGNLNFAGATELDLVFNVDSTVDWTSAFWDTDQSWLLFQVSNVPIGSFSNFSINSQNWADSLGQLFGTARPTGNFTLGESGGDIYLYYGPAAVPEPGSIILMGLVSLIGGGSAARRYFRRRQKTTTTA